MTRYEIKLVGRERDHARIMTELQLLPILLQRDHATRLVQSIYFDTWDGQALADNLAGIARRRKVRFRWYGEASAAVVGQLERKCRDGLLGDKDVFSATVPVRVDGASRAQFAAALRAVLPAPAHALLDGQEPVQWIRYRRDYLRTADQSMRVTVDRELAAFDQRFEGVLGCRRPTPLPELLIVEVKAAASERDMIERWLQTVDLRPSKCSKFVLASSPRESPLVSPLV